MKRFWLVAICMLITFSAMFIIADHIGYTDEAYARAQLVALGQRPHGRWWVAGAVVGLLLIDLLLPVPSSIVMLVSGAVLGVVAGTAASFAGAMLAALVGFFACRWGGQDVMRKFIGAEDVHAVGEWFSRYGVLAIIISRPVPMLTEILSCLAGLSDLRARTFIAASVLGTLPICAIYAYFGAISATRGLMPAVWVAILIPAAGWLLTQRIKGSCASEDAESTPPIS